MLRSIATASISGTLKEKLKAIRAAGFDGIELFENDLISCDETPEKVRKACADLGLSIMLFQPFRDFEGVDESHFRQNLERARRKFDVMNRLGVDKILVCSNASQNSIPNDSLIIDQLGELARVASSFEIRAGYESLAWGHHVNRWEHCWRLVHAVNHPALGIIVDSFHILAVGDSPEGIANIPGDRITFAQLADAPRMSLDVLEWSRHHRCFPGQGDLDVARFTRALLASGYTGPLSLEVFNDSFRAAPSARTAGDAFRSLLHLESQLATHAIPAADRVHPAPQSFKPEGFDFVEFAVSEETATDLGTWLRRAGFIDAGLHHSKDVRLLRQGSAALVLNAQNTSFASDYFRAHGASACACAYRVEGAKELVSNAVSLGYERIEESRRPNEAILEGVVAPDGSHHYFVENDKSTPSSWEFDFSSASAGKARTTSHGSVTHIDHISLIIPSEAMDSWVLFYRSLFDAQPEQPVWVADPYGLVCSRAIRTRDGALRIILNASAATGQTTAATSLQEYAGGGLNHVALATDDVIATVTRLRENQAEMLPIPDNYYEDLRARYGEKLPVGTLASLGILYDRDERGGEYFHAFTRPFRNRFYIEIVQRTNGYSGFGVSNARIRIAATTAMREQQLEGEPA